MSIISSTARSLAIATGLTVAVAGPAVAAKRAPSITVPARAVQDPASKLCMPKTVLGRSADKTMPDTLCMTKDEWVAQGVTVVVK